MVPYVECVRWRSGLYHRSRIPWYGRFKSYPSQASVDHVSPISQRQWINVPVITGDYNGVYFRSVALPIGEHPGR